MRLKAKESKPTLGCKDCWRRWTGQARKPVIGISECLKISDESAYIATVNGHADDAGDVLLGSDQSHLHKLSFGREV